MRRIHLHTPIPIGVTSAQHLMSKAVWEGQMEAEERWKGLELLPPPPASQDRAPKDSKDLSRMSPKKNGHPKKHNTE